MASSAPVDYVRCAHCAYWGMTSTARTTTGRGVWRGLWAVTALMMLLFVAVFALHRITPLPALKAMVDIGGEANMPTWWNASLLLMAGVAAVVARWDEEQPDIQRAWAVVAAAAVYLSIDEATGLHELLGQPLGVLNIDVPTYNWVLPGVVLALAGTAGLVAVGRRLPTVVRRRLAVALGCYFAGAIGVEAFNGWVGRGDAGPVFTLGMIVEESLEMGACILAIVAVVDHLVTRRTASESESADAPAFGRSADDRDPAVGSANS